MESITSIELTDYKLVRHGKVRSIFCLDPGRLLIIATDRISAYDAVLPSGIPGKGIILTQLSNFWFDLTRSIQPNHMLSSDPGMSSGTFLKDHPVLRGRSVIVKKLEIIPYECIVRGYISGSMWAEYKKGGSLPDTDTPAGLSESDRLSEPLFTPTTKAHSGHDQPVSMDILKNEVGVEIASLLKDRSIALYQFAAGYALQRGIIIADTKFEFGILEGILVLGDELLTPDSSRFWPAESYSPGGPQSSFDKQYVRDYLTRAEWNRQPPAPELPFHVVNATQSKYLEAYRRLTGKPLDLSLIAVQQDELS